MSPLISLSGVGKTFGEGRIVALDNITLDVRPGEFVSLIGPSGCGKTTLLRLMNGLAVPDSGTVTVGGRAPVPNAGLAMVFQTARLLPWRSVAANIEFVLALRGLSRRDRRARALALLGAVGLRDVAQAFPHELSSGMQQRVGLARALAVEPDVLLMDEPFAALDALTRETLREELSRLWSRTRMAVVFVTHDIDEAILLSQRIVLMRPRPGRIERVFDVDLPQPRFEGDPRALPEFALLRRTLWQAIAGMAQVGPALGGLDRVLGQPPEADRRWPGA